MSTETWRPVPGFERYEVSDHGRLRSRARGSVRILACPVASNGYRMTVLSAGGPRKNVTVHSIVALAFHGERPTGQQVRHLDGNRLNNVPANLAYGTPKQNTADSLDHRTHSSIRKTHCVSGHPFSPDNTRIGSKGDRICVTCTRARGRAYARRQRGAA